MDATSFRDYNNTAYYLDPANTGISMVVAGKVLIGQTGDATTYRLQVAGTAGSSGDVSIDSKATYSEIQSFNSKPLYINPLGNNLILNKDAGSVGIGTVSPAEKLSVNQGNFYALRTGGAKLRLLDENNEVSLESSPVGVSSEMVFKTNTTERMRLTSTGLGIGTTSPATALHIVGEHRIEHAADKAMSFVRSGSNTFSIEHDTARFYFYNSSTANSMLTMMNGGNVGIGTLNPGYKLEVNGAFAATTKSFVINHPTKPDMKLRYGSLEGPENGVYVRGRTKGNTIQLPDYWTGLVDEFSITVNLTPIGSHQKLYVKSIDKNIVTIGGGLFDQMEYFYTVFAERKDVDKLIVEI
jgi:hypothetical protein